MVQQLHVTDASWLAALHRQAFENPWSAVSFAEILALPTTLGWALIPETTPGPVGFILLQAQGQEGEILTFQVATDHQGRGYGRALLTQGSPLRGSSTSNICFWKWPSAADAHRKFIRPRVLESPDGERTTIEVKMGRRTPW